MDKNTRKLGRVGFYSPDGEITLHEEGTTIIHVVPCQVLSRSVSGATVKLPTMNEPIFLLWEKYYWFALVRPHGASEYVNDIQPLQFPVKKSV